MQYCQNCEKSLPKQKFELHLGYCRRNIRKCERCRRPYDVNQEEEHEEQFHSLAKCQFCQGQFAPAELADHTFSCPMKSIQCEHCDLKVPRDMYEEHIKQCEARTKTCEKCNKAIQMKVYYVHQAECAEQQAWNSNENSRSPSAVVRTPAENIYQQYPAVSVTRLVYDANSGNQPIRHSVRELGQRTTVTRVISPEESPYYSQSSSQGYNYNPGSVPSHMNSANLQAMSQNANRTHMVQHRLVNLGSDHEAGNQETFDNFHSKSEPLHHTNRDASHLGYSQDDADLQAALFASMGFQMETFPEETNKKHHDGNKKM